jgi:hypothetical protein
MRLLEERAVYENLQNHLARAIAKTIKWELEKRELSVDLVKDLTADLTFSVATVLDASAIVEIEGGTLKPIITFQTDTESLVWVGGTSYMHDEVYGWVYDLFLK